MKCIFQEKLMNYIKICSLLITPLTRITIAGVFVFAGWGKLTHLDRTIEYFASLGMPMAHLLAPFVSAVEFIFGLFIFFGFATRVAAIPLSITMIIAILTAKSSEITGIQSLFEMTEFLYILLLLWLTAQGAGRISVDHLLKRKVQTCLK